ncbi:MAG: hypothetical protein QOH28_2743 [Actinomycetota bacterium]|nr:hypothetical protein [Actinomycetota bacterium]
MILLAGGTGRLGTIVADRLSDRGIQVRVLTRDPSRADRIAGRNVDVVSGDVRDPESLRRATDGIEVVVSAMHGFTGPRGTSPATVDRDGNVNLIDATKAAGADLVLMSTVGAAADSPMELFRMKHAAEQHAVTSGVPATIVRATAFLELWIEILRKTAGRSGRPLVFGRGDNAINFVSVNDVAALVEHVVTDRTSRGTTLEIGGPENLTFNELARAMQKAAGRGRAPRHVPPLMLRVMANTIGRMNPQVGRQARAALVMDHTDLTFDAADVHRRFPDVPCTPLSRVLADMAAA